MALRSFALLAAMMLACSPTSETPTGAGGGALSAADAAAIVAAADRSEADRERDARRRPAELLAFIGVREGARVADIGAGSGYTTELLARAVGPEGVVYGHNEPAVIEKFVGESWPARLAKPINGNVVRVDRGFGDPLPAEVTDLDAITMIFVYHDTPLYSVDRATMNERLFRALRPGGTLVIVDHHAKAGAPVEETAETLHRIDAAVVRRELESVGFELDGTADFLRNADDPREEAFFKMDAPTDAFVQRWTKPANAGSS